MDRENFMAAIVPFGPFMIEPDLQREQKVSIKVPHLQLMIRRGKPHIDSLKVKSFIH